MYTLEEIIKKAKKIHGDKYDYSKSVYTKLVEPIEIICPIHGSFFQSPHQHLKGQGCPKCGIEARAKKKTDTTETFIEKARKVHGDKYDYSKVEYKGTKSKVCIICPEHGEFWQIPNSHLMGKGCPDCAAEVCRNARILSTEEFIERANKTHGGKYDYSKTVYERSNKKITIICPIHGEFKETPAHHLAGHGCPECAKETRAMKRIKSTEQFIADAKKIHGEKYSYDKVEYKGCFEPVTITCPVHGDFSLLPTYHLSGSGCPKCANVESDGEVELYSFIANIVGNDNVIKKDRTVLDGHELDIYIPEKKIAFEYDGLYWHCEINKPGPKYHLMKTEKCAEKGIRLIHIFEDEWIYKNEICRSRIKNILNACNKTIYARNCTIINVDYKRAKDFINANHIQGYVGGQYAYGLEYQGRLVSIMTFSSLRKNMGRKKEDGVYELLRFCSAADIHVVGAAGKLFSHFIKEVAPKKVISYADRRWSQGGLYEKLGFTHIHNSQPNYFYIFGQKRKNRFNFRKDILVSKYGCPKDETEHNFCLQNHWYRIYDCGSMLYEWKNAPE